VLGPVNWKNFMYRDDLLCQRLVSLSRLFLHAELARVVTSRRMGGLYSSGGGTYLAWRIICKCRGNEILLRFGRPSRWSGFDLWAKVIM